MAEIADSIIVKIQADVAELKKGMQTAQKDIKDFSSQGKKDAVDFGNVFETAIGVGIANFAMSAASSVKNFVSEGVKDFAQYEMTLSSFKYMTGVMADTILNDMDRMAEGTVSKLDLVKNANTALVLGIEQEMLPKLMEISRASAKILGGDTQMMFNSIVTGIGRQSRLMLDNLGIIVKISDAEKEYALKIGKTVSALSDAEKAQAFRQGVLEAGENIIKKAAGAEDDLSTSIGRQAKAWKDLKLEMGELFGPVLTGVFQGTAYAIDNLNQNLNHIQNSLTTTSEQQFLAARNAAYLKSTYEGLSSALNIVVEDLNNEKMTLEEVNPILISSLELQLKTVDELKTGVDDARRSYEEFTSSILGMRLEGETENLQKRNDLLLKANEYQRQYSGLSREDALSFAGDDLGYTIQEIDLLIEKDRLYQESISLTAKSQEDLNKGVITSVQEAKKSIEEQAESFRKSKNAAMEQILTIEASQPDFLKFINERTSVANDLLIKFENINREAAKIGTWSVDEEKLNAATKRITAQRLNPVVSNNVNVKMNKMNDFVMRPGQAAVPFSSDDTIIGTKGGIGSTVIVKIEAVYGLDPENVANALEEKLHSRISR